MASEAQDLGPDLGIDGVSVDDLEIGVPHKGHVDGKAVVVVATDTGIHAVGGSCTHYGGPLGDGLCADGQIRCPWHHAAFDLVTGEAVGAPALNPIRIYRVDERGGRVLVTGPVDVPTPERTPTATPESVVIVGSGAAGAAAAEGLRRHGYTGPVTMIGSEAPVDRPNLSKDYLAGTAPEEWLPLRSPDFYADHDIDLVSDAVTALDPGGRTVTLASGRREAYGALLIATGATPRAIPIPGADLPIVHMLRTVDDTRAIIAALDGVDRAVIVGAGFIGLEVAASLRHRDIEVVVVAPEEVPLAGVVGETLGRRVTGLHRGHGVEFRLGRGVSEIRPGAVTLDDGTAEPADLVVVGIGVIPRTELAEAAGLAVDNGIVVDDRLRTADPHIWAAGDVANYPHGGERGRIEHWVLAERQGQAAARNMLGADEAFTEPPFFWSQHYDVQINVTGHLRGWDEEVVRGDPDGDILVGYRKDGRVVAVATVGRDLDNLRAEQALATGDQATLEELLG